MPKTKTKTGKSAHPPNSNDTLVARVFEAECEAYPEAIRLFAEGRSVVTNGMLQIVD